MRDYGQYCPVALGSEVLGDRWTPLIVREMILGSTRFNEIERGLPGISRTLLSQRLRRLERNGALERRPARSGRGSEYHLTPAGQDLERVIMAMGEWWVRWMFAEPTPEQVDPVALTWWLYRRIDVERVPDERVVIEFRYRGGGTATTTIWIVLDRQEQSVCIKHPGFESDLIVTTDPVSFMRVFSGIVTVARAVDEGTVTIEGPPQLRRGFPTWFLWSPFAPAVEEYVVPALS
jgi:DNA-binding HxlR family transcriptional regulator